MTKADGVHRGVTHKSSVGSYILQRFTAQDVRHTDSSHGEEDDTVPPENAHITYESVKDRVPAMLYMVPGAKHGYGVGQSSNAAEGCKEWPGQADEFMQSLR